LMILMDDFMIPLTIVAAKSTVLLAVALIYAGLRTAGIRTNHERFAKTSVPFVFLLGSALGLFRASRKILQVPTTPDNTVVRALWN
jgi:hypothetical protein